MIIPLVLELRRRQVPVGLQEVVALAEALSQGLHDSSFDEFYMVVRSILIHHERHLDDYDQVFGHLYRGLPLKPKEILDDLERWLQNPVARRELSEEDRAALKEIDIEELKRMFEERMKEQQERHDGGSHWIGTGGTSPFGTGGYHPSGISLRSGQSAPGGGGRSLMRSVDARRYRGYRSDLVLDVRQMEVALRKLRTFGCDERADELDLASTIDATAKAFGELELKFKKPRRPNTRVILMMDIGGSMDPYAALVSQLFSAARRATHWKELRTYYFHNCVYGQVYRTEGLRDALSLKDLFRECDGGRYKLIFVGDASMAPYELLGDPWGASEETRISGIQWLAHLRRHFPASVWVNPELTAGFNPAWMGDTVIRIAQVLPMLPLSIAGLEEGLGYLKSARVSGGF